MFMVDGAINSLFKVTKIDSILTKYSDFTTFEGIFGEGGDISPISSTLYIYVL